MGTGFLNTQMNEIIDSRIPEVRATKKEPSTPLSEYNTLNNTFFKKTKIQSSQINKKLT